MHPPIAHAIVGASHECDGRGVRHYFRMKKIQAASAPSHAVKQAGACACIELQAVCSCRVPHGRSSGLLATCMRYPLFRVHAHGPGHVFSRSHQRLCGAVWSIATNRRCAIHGCGLQHSVARSLQRLLVACCSACVWREPAARILGQRCGGSAAPMRRTCVAIDVLARWRSKCGQPRPNTFPLPPLP